MVQPYQCFALQVNTATARSRQGAIYETGVMISSSLPSETPVEHDMSAGYWRYYNRAGVVVMKAIVGRKGDTLVEIEPTPRDSMPVTNWTHDHSDATAPLAAYLEAPRSHDGGLYLSFHGLQLESVMNYLHSVHDMPAHDMPRIGLARVLETGLDATIAHHQTTAAPALSQAA